MRRDVRWTALIAVLMLVVAACGGGTDGDGDTAEVGSDATAATESADESAADDSADKSADATDDTGETAGDTNESADDGTVEIDEEMSAAEIAELIFPTFDEANIENQQAQWEDQERERQSLIAECMAGLGFEYTPVDYGDTTFFGGFGDDLDPTSREYAETYGFGFTTFAFEDFGEESADTFVDPNEEYIAGLSESAQQAYYDALYGTPPEFDPNLSDEEFDQLFEENPELFEPQGCDGEAWNATNQYAQLDDVYQALGDSFEELYERVQADPRIAAFEQEWAECMVGKGHPYADMDEMYEALSERSNVLYGPPDGFVDPFEGLTDEQIDAMIDELSEEELNELFSGPEPDPEVLAETQEWEIALAVDSWDCGGASQFEEFDEIFAEYQDEFIEENLDAIRAALSENG